MISIMIGSDLNVSLSNVLEEHYYILFHIIMNLLYLK